MRGASPNDSSSMSSSFGSLDSTAASPSICCSPPDSRPGGPVEQPRQLGKHGQHVGRCRAPGAGSRGRVRPKKIERSSVMRPRPRRARAASDDRSGSPEEPDLARDRTQRAGHRQQRGRLARTVATQERDDLTRGDAEVEVTDDGHASVAGVHVSGLQHGAHVRTVRPGLAHVASPRNAAMTLGSDSTRFGRALGDHLPEVERDDPVGHAPDQMDVVLDQQHAHAPALGQRPDHLADLFAARGDRDPSTVRRGEGPTARSRSHAQAQRACACRC